LAAFLPTGEGKDGHYRWVFFSVVVVFHILSFAKKQKQRGRKKKHVWWHQKMVEGTVFGRCFNVACQSVSQQASATLLRAVGQQG